jgi:hypothetical protein
MDASARTWTQVEQDLWARVAAHSFETSAVALDFTRRLAAHMSWSLAMAREAVGEYRKFCFLATVSTQGPVTPSEEVDEVWHLHLAYTRDYWDRWCGDALGRRLHHDPTSGGPMEASRFRVQYAATLALYEAYFGPPPALYWPGTTQRFAGKPRYRMVDTQRILLLRRPTLLRATKVAVAAGILALVGTPAAADVDWATTWNPLDWSGPPFLEAYGTLLVIALLAMWGLQNWACRTDGRVDVSDLVTIDIGFLKGGPMRAVDTGRHRDGHPRPGQDRPRWCRDQLQRAGAVTRLRAVPLDDAGSLQTARSQARVSALAAG